MNNEKEYYSFEDMCPNDVMHYGTPRHSGRYPWGSGAKYHQKRTDFISRNIALKNEGVSEHDRAVLLGCRNIDHLRAKVERYGAEIEMHEVTMVQKLKDKGWSNVAIAKRLGVSEGTVRNHLAKSTSGELKMESVMKVRNILVEELENKNGLLDVGKESNLHIGVSPDKLKRALENLKDEGYHVRTLKIPQQGTVGQLTTLKVLTPPEMTWKEMFDRRFEIGNLAESNVYLEDNGNGEVVRLRPPTQLDGKRIFVRYAEDGGTARDGMVELRRGVEDLDMGNSKYAQVRIAVDGKSYIKGMAVYSDNIPDGYDIVVNSNKTRDADFYSDVLKPLKSDPLNPFGTAIKAGGQKGALNIVREEGEWSDWSRNLPSQFLSKQPLDLARTQLTLTKDIKRQQFEDIMAITNPTLRKKLMLEFADECDADAVALKAASMPRQATQVILPIPSLKENECYAPGFKDGEVLSLIRFPHGGKFEIPEVIVNNKNAEANGIMKNAVDAIGINPKTASILSGADFDGDTVLAIPNNDRRIKNKAPLEGLKDFDTGEYKVPKGMSPLRKGWEKGSPREGREMGVASNLITDMTLQGATDDELERAVKYSMVVIDTGKHKLDWYRCYQDCGIQALKDKYQGHYNELGNWVYGSRTLISKAKSQTSVEKHSDSYTIDDETGEKIYKPKKDRYGNVMTGTQKDTKMGAAKDARELLNPDSTEMERIYADYANAMKSLGNEARKATLTIEENKVSNEAKTKYSNAVASLDAKLIEAKKNAPLERQAQLIAGSLVKIQLESNPDMSKGEIKKARGKAIVQARQMNGAAKKRIKFTDEEWEAMENGAVAKSKMTEIFNNADQDSLMEHAFPKNNVVMTTSRLTLANSMLNSGHTIADVAEHFGVSTKTLTDALRKED